MPTMVFALRVEMEDGTVHTTSADQRDIARWEQQPDGFPMGKISELMSARFLRFLGYSALQRAGEYTGTFREFDKTCVEVADETPEEPDGDDAGVDPGQPTVSAARSSPSASRRAGRSKRSNG